MKGLKKYMAGILVAGMVLGSAAVPAPVYATEAEDAQEDNGDDVEITLDDKPYLALGADLTADQQHTVLSYMGIEAADFDKYDVVYVSNAEEHQYLDSYVPKKQIGTKALSSVLVSLADSGNGLKVSTYNINYCTAGMYKNALATAGVEDANVIVAGPFPLSGTAALVGTFEAYEKLTGKELDESVVDAAMDELVTTGDLEQSIDGDSNDVEAMSQYTPLEHVRDYPELAHRVSRRTYDRYVDAAIALGITQAFIQEPGVAKESFIPDFSNAEGV